MGRRHGGKGAGRSPSMRRRIVRNSSLGTATSASWKVTYRPWLMTLAPILISFSLSVVRDQCSASLGALRAVGVVLWIRDLSRTTELDGNELNQREDVC